jgi:hypothetical protein
MNKDELLKKDHFGLQIMQDKSICIDDTPISGFIFVACGQGEGPRSYAMSWYEGELRVHIYLSDTLKDQEENILQSLDEKLSLCKSAEDLIALNGQKLS